jgi:uncharacterized protein YkwD
VSGRGTLLALAALLVVLLLAPAAPAQTGGIALTSAEQSLLRAVNDARTARGLAALRVDARLQRAARSHSRALLALDRLDHGDFVGRLRAHGVRGGSLAENLAWGTGSYARAAAIVRAWLDSPGHRRNLLGSGFRRIGIGAAVGEFAGAQGARVVTADFAG